MDPATLTAIIQALGAIDQFSNSGTQTENANAIDQNQFDLDIWSILASLIPNLERERQLDPVRNAIISDVGREFFPNVNPSTFDTIRDAGPRPGVVKPPTRQPLQQPDNILNDIIGITSPISHLFGGGDDEKRGRRDAKDRSNQVVGQYRQLLG